MCERGGGEREREREREKESDEYNNKAVFNTIP